VLGEHDLAILEARLVLPALARLGLDLPADLTRRLEHADERLALALDVDVVALPQAEVGVPVAELVHIEQDRVVQVVGHGRASKGGVPKRYGGRN
jgi:hypothetical protein